MKVTLPDGSPLELPDGATGADAAAHPRPGRITPRHGPGRNSRPSRPTSSTVGRAGRVWPKSASSRVTDRPPPGGYTRRGRADRKRPVSGRSVLVLGWRVIGWPCG